MICSAVVDTNVLVTAAIGSPDAAPARVLDAYFEGRFRLVVSPSTLDELVQVLLLPKIAACHGWSDDEVLEFVVSLQAQADVYQGDASLPASLTRDLTDTKFLALAAEAAADFLVTNDRRHLLRLKRFHRTRIVTPHRFLMNIADGGHS